MEIQKVILVDPDDQKIGELEKIRAHHYGMLHRAFSILLFRQRGDKIETLLQQRSKAKYHGGGLWTNTCCSHQYVGEQLAECVVSRLQLEMGIKTQLQEIGKFHYIAKLDNNLTENEIDHVFIGFYDADTIEFNPQEVSQYLWIEVNDLKIKLAQSPEKYTPWFAQALELALQNLEEWKHLEEFK